MKLYFRISTGDSQQAAARQNLNLGLARRPPPREPKPKETRRQCPYTEATRRTTMMSRYFLFVSSRAPFPLVASPSKPDPPPMASPKLPHSLLCASPVLSPPSVRRSGRPLYTFKKWTGRPARVVGERAAITVARSRAAEIGARPPVAPTVVGCNRAALPQTAAPPRRRAHGGREQRRQHSR